jgi:hypothetical protein
MAYSLPVPASSKRSVVKQYHRRVPAGEWVLIPRTTTAFDPRRWAMGDAIRNLNGVLI